jgi:uncharacterized protein YjbI with pentapeptide repeats
MPKLPSNWKLMKGYLVGPGANLTGADLSNTRLTGMDLTNTNLSGADLSGAVLTGVTSGGIIGDPKLPSGWKLISGFLVGPESNLKLASLLEQDLSGMNLSGANLSGAKLKWASLVGSNLTGVKLLRSNLINSALANSNLTNADLSKADLSKAELTGANLTSANLSGTILANTKLAGVISKNISGMPKLPSNWKLMKGYLVGPGANLTGADLSNTRLTGMDLTNTNLKKAKLLGVSSAKVIGNPILPDGWVLVKGYLVGPGSNLKGADLRGANLSGAILKGANLQGASLLGAKLSHKVANQEIKGKPKSLPNGWIIVRGRLKKVSHFPRN